VNGSFKESFEFLAGSKLPYSVNHLLSGQDHHTLKRSGQAMWTEKCPASRLPDSRGFSSVDRQHRIRKNQNVSSFYGTEIQHGSLGCKISVSQSIASAVDKPQAQLETWGWGEEPWGVCGC
jgi:hypothetical protein